MAWTCPFASFLALLVLTLASQRIYCIVGQICRVLEGVQAFMPELDSSSSLGFWPNPFALEDSMLHWSKRVSFWWSLGLRPDLNILGSLGFRSKRVLLKEFESWTHFSCLSHFPSFVVWEFFSLVKLGFLDSSCHFDPNMMLQGSSGLEPRLRLSCSSVLGSSFIPCVISGFLGWIVGLV